MLILRICAGPFIGNCQVPRYTCDVRGQSSGLGSLLPPWFWDRVSLVLLPHCILKLLADSLISCTYWGHKCGLLHPIFGWILSFELRSSWNLTCWAVFLGLPSVQINLKGMYWFWLYCVLMKLYLLTHEYACIWFPISYFFFLGKNTLSIGLMPGLGSMLLILALGYLRGRSGGAQWLPGQAGLYSKSLCQNKNKSTADYQTFGPDVTHL